MPSSVTPPGRSPTARPLGIDPPVDARRARRMGHDVAHPAGPRRGALALLVPLGGLRDLLVLELVDGGVARLALGDAVAPRVDDAGHLPVAGDVLAAVPLVPLRVDVV